VSVETLPRRSAFPTPDAAAPAGEAATSSRLTSLDALRGLTIVGMVLANDEGGLSHARWNGFTLADLVFPSFLLIMGAAMAYSFAKGVSRGRVVRRAATLFALGFAMNAVPHVDWHEVRVMGVLQRIALAYLIASWVVLHVPRRRQWWLAGALLVGYWGAMTVVPVPGHGAGALTPGGNLAGYLDRLVFGVRHMYLNGPYDPEGLLSTLPAVVSVLIGYRTGEWLRHQPKTPLTSATLLGAGVACVTAGALWNPLFPINKRLWTSSYVLFAAGWGLVLLAVAYQLVEVHGWHALGWPFRVLGLNAIFVYVASEELGMLVGLHRPAALPHGRAFALSMIGAVWVLTYALYRRRIFIRV
jgi:predicted acyltransferase